MATYKCCFKKNITVSYNGYTVSILYPGISVNVTQPDGTVLTSSYPGYSVDNSFKRLDINIDGTAHVCTCCIWSSTYLV